MSRNNDCFIDLAYERDSEGIYDLVVDTENGDFQTTDGLETAIFVSLFSDRRALPDEVADPFRRRGWIGDLVSEVPTDRFGSGLWFYEQSRLSQDTVTGVRVESEAALDWMVEEQLVTYAEASVISFPAERLATLDITAHLQNGGVVSEAYVLADATRQGALVNL